MGSHNKALPVSIIIPAYNEESHLAACLESIAQQTVQPYEVIVVDNNSRDGTAEVAGSFDFVTLYKEKKQGLIPARNTGFNRAGGEILARINADVVLDFDWVQRIQTLFQDIELQGVTGPVRTKIIPGLPGHTTVYSRGYFLIANAIFRIPILWGANMALRSSMWAEIKNDACKKDELVHEDQDLSVLIAGNGGKLLQDNHLLAETHEHSYFYWPKYREYNWRQWKTLRRHQRLGTYSKTVFSSLPVWRSLVAGAIVLVTAVIFTLASFLGYLFSFKWLNNN